MGWSELERLVDQAEADGTLRRALRHCRSQEELVLAARQLGFRITRMDLQRARELHDRDGVGGRHPGPQFGESLNPSADQR